MTPSIAYSQTFKSLIEDVRNLITLHPSQEGTPGRPAGDTGPLLRSAIVLIHTAWENYVEQIAVEGQDFFLSAIEDDHTKLPHAMTQRLAAAKNPWALAGQGWQTEARNVLGKQVGRLNTPNVENTEALLDLAVGLPSGLHGISWQKTDSEKVLGNIDKFVHEIRGEIVHKGTTPGPLHKGGVKSWITFFEGLTLRLDKRIESHLRSTTGATPW